ncbi:MAG TPA: 30S ribosomal protein S9, partial [Candidatus Paceibacterota bacterium]
MTTTEAKTRYFEAVGRRKTAIARARITPASKQSIVINDKTSADYFATAEMRMIAEAA